MKAILILLITISCLVKAQSHRFIYEYQFVVDSLKRDSVSKKLMRLNITKDFSEFMPEKKAKNDSTIMKNIGLNTSFNIEFSANSLSSDSYTDYNTHETIIYGEIGIQQATIKMDTLPNWTLLKNTKKINNYNCQKATTQFGGRTWTAWFTTDLPFQEGPYVFKGLPGLIVELEDASKSHHFLLVGNHNSDNLKSNRFTMGSVVALDEKKFNKEWKKFRENPIPVMTQMQNRGITFLDDGTQFAPNHKEEIESIKKDIAANNNAILLNLYR